MLPLLILLLRLYQLWTLGALSGWSLSLFTRSSTPPPHHLPNLPLSTFLLFGTWRCFMCTQSIAYFPWPMLEATSSPRSPSSFYWRMVFRNQDLARCPHHYQDVIASKPFQQTKLGNTHTHIHIRTRTRTLFGAHTHIYLHFLKNPMSLY